MKLRITAKYIDELTEKYCSENKQTVGGYSMKRKFFQIYPIIYIVLVNEEELVLVRLTALGNVHSAVSYSPSDFTSLKLSRKILSTKLGIVFANKKKLNLFLQRKIIGLSNNQKITIEMLQKFSEKVH